jgi:hypothetical protein
LAAVRFLVVPRGYAMDQVDHLIRRLQRQLALAEFRASRTKDGPDSANGDESGIIEADRSSDRRADDGGDETSHG